MNNKLLLIAGTRNFSDYETLCRGMAAFVKTHGLPDAIISGGATGADALGERWALENNIPVDRHPAEWKKYGNKAGPFRNKTMAEKCDCALIYWDGESRGTKNVITNLKAAGKNYILTIYRP